MLLIPIMSMGNSKKKWISFIVHTLGPWVDVSISVVFPVSHSYCFHDNGTCSKLCQNGWWNDTKLGNLWVYSPVIFWSVSILGISTLYKYPPLYPHSVQVALSTRDFGTEPNLHTLLLSVWNISYFQWRIVQLAHRTLHSERRGRIATAPPLRRI